MTTEKSRRGPCQRCLNTTREPRDQFCAACRVTANAEVRECPDRDTTFGAGMFACRNCGESWEAHRPRYQPEPAVTVTDAEVKAFIRAIDDGPRSYPTYRDSVRVGLEAAARVRLTQ